MTLVQLYIDSEIQKGSPSPNSPIVVLILCSRLELDTVWLGSFATVAGRSSNLRRHRLFSLYACMKLFLERHRDQ